MPVILEFFLLVKFTCLSEYVWAFAFFSAGIGRTGVLITMETALILIEKAQAVYPLEIVASLREQRPMMVQTSVHTVLSVPVL